MKYLLFALKASLFQLPDPCDKSGEEKNGRFRNSSVLKNPHGLREFSKCSGDANHGLKQ